MHNHSKVSLNSSHPLMYMLIVAHSALLSEYSGGNSSYGNHIHSESTPMAQNAMSSYSRPTGYMLAYEHHWI